MTTLPLTRPINWTVALSGAWVLLFAASVLLFQNLGQTPVAAPGRVIAKLTETRGDTLYRPSSLTIWGSANAGLDLRNGDLISTGDGASAEIQFATGQTIVLDSATQFMVSEGLDSAGNSSFEIKLVKGTVLVRKPKNNDWVAKPPVRVKSGDQVQELAPVDAPVVVSKAEASAPMQVTTQAPPLAVARVKDPVVTPKLAAAEVKLPVLKAAPPPKPLQGPIAVMKPGAGAAWQLRLRNAKDLTLLSPWLGKPEDYKIAKLERFGGKQAATTVWILRGDRIVASLRGASLANVAQAAGLLRASVAFSGPADAYLGGPEVLEQFAAESESRSVFLSYKDRTVTLDTKVLSLHASARAAISDKLKAVFSKPVKVWYQP